MEPTYLGLELGSTRIKAITIDHCFQNIASGNSTWASTFENGIWTYPLEACKKPCRSFLAEKTSAPWESPL